MARTGEQQAKEASGTYGAQSKQAFTGAQGDIGKFNSNVTALQAGKPVAANPWQNPDYLASQNRLQSSSLNAADNSAKADIDATNRRTGGLNTGAATAAKTGLALQKMRLANSLSSGRSAEDWNKNVGYQGKVAEMPLEAARAESPLYATATGGEADANKNLAQFGLQSQAFWDQLAMMGTKGLAGWVTGGMPGAAAGMGVQAHG